MERVSVKFIWAALIYLTISVTVGVFMVFWIRGAGIYLSVHAHLNLLGWVSMFIFGIAYHILPRFSGQPLYSKSLAEVHFYLANVGLIGMALFWSFYRHTGKLPYLHTLGVFAIIEAISVYFFVYNILRTVKGLEE